jgi:hypothetical protein
MADRVEIVLVAPDHLRSGLRHALGPLATGVRDFEDLSQACLGTSRAGLVVLHYAGSETPNMGMIARLMTTVGFGTPLLLLVDGGRLDIERIDDMAAPLGRILTEKPPAKPADVRDLALRALRIRPGQRRITRPPAPKPVAEAALREVQQRLEAARPDELQEDLSWDELVRAARQRALQHDYAAAVVLVEQALAIEDSSGLQYARALYQGYAALRASNSNKARGHFERALTLAPSGNARAARRALDELDGPTAAAPD